jgi:peptide/nickel transport system permease protein
MNGRKAGVLRTMRDLPFAAILLLLPVTICGVVGQFFTPHDPGAINPSMALRPPSSTYLFGTDYLGRDVLSRVIMGARASLLVSFTGVILAGIIGVILGLVAAYFIRW